MRRLYFERKLNLKNEKCIPIKRALIAYMSKNFFDFSFQGSSGNLYAFCRENNDGIYDHIIMQREFYEGTISMIITELASCYNRSWRGIPWFAIGYETDIQVLKTGMKYYDATLGWHKVDNCKNELDGLFSAIKSDIDTYAMPYFLKNHDKLNADKLMTITNTYMQAQIITLNPNQVDEIKEFLVTVNQSYCAYRKECRKNNRKEQIEHFDILPQHPLIEQWLSDIQKQLNYSNLSKNIRKQLIRDTTILFRDAFDFYGLK